MKVLFLDIDGVVNCQSTAQRHRGMIGIDPYMAFLIGKITLDVPNLKVVLSSSWRHWTDGIKEVEEQVVPILDITPTIALNPRGKEIKAWLEDHKEVTRYAIVDDYADMLPEQMPNFFRTSWLHGITKEIADEITKHFNDTK